MSTAPGRLPQQTDTVAVTELRAGALGLPSVLMTAVTTTAPALGIVLTVQFIATLAGVATPLAYLIGFIVVLTLAVPFAQLAKHLPSAGGYFTYISRGVHPRAGFFAAWAFIMYLPIVPAIDLPFTGVVLQQVIKDEYNFAFPWWLFTILASIFLFVVTYRGIKISADVLIPLGIAEMLIIVGLALWGIANPGPGGFNFSGFSPGSAISLNGLALGVIFTIFGFAGWDSAAPIAEESKSPRRTVPRAVVASVFILALFFIVSAFGVMVGWGTNGAAGFESNAVNPTFVLAKHFWGGAWVLVPLALLNSTLAVSLGCFNASTRMWFGMARIGAAPKLLAKVHPQRKVPVNAVYAEAVITLVGGLGLGIAFGPEGQFFMMGLVITLALVAIYTLGNLAVFLFFRRERPQDFNFFLHAALPVLATVALVLITYNSLVPLPAAPVLYGPFIAAVWGLVGVGILIWMWRAGREDWLMKAGTVVVEGPAKVTDDSPMGRL